MKISYFRNIFDEFISKFYELFSEERKRETNIKINFQKEADGTINEADKMDIKIDSKSIGFSSLISKLHAYVDLCDPNITLEMDLKNPKLITYGISEEYFRMKIQDYFLVEIKKSLNPLF